jgi:hypothetical protein
LRRAKWVCLLSTIVVAGTAIAVFFPGGPRRSLAPPARGEAAGQAVSSTSVTLPRPSPGAAPAAQPVSAAAVPPAKLAALLIGVNHAAGHAPLEGAVKDATNLQQALVEYGFPEANIVLLTEREATASRILAELDRLAARVPPDGRAVFAFAGHTRLVGGVPHFVAADGGLIPAGTIAAKLARVRAPTWVALPTCFAGGYALPGIIGPRRIATFSSSADQETYELGSAGSWLILYMVEYAMLDGVAPQSVEASFDYARAAIAKVNPDREPFMVDGIAGGDFVLGVRHGPVPNDAAASQPARDDPASPPQQAEDEPSPRPVKVCFAGHCAA